MRPNHNLSDAQFTAAANRIFNVNPAPATVAFDHDADEIRAAMVRAGVLRPRATTQLPEAR